MSKIANILNLEDCNIEQLNFIKSDLQDCCLIGIPGGGKTTTIIKKILFGAVRQHLIDHAVFHRLLSRHKIVSVSVTTDLIDSLASFFCQDRV